MLCLYDIHCRKQWKRPHLTALLSNVTEDTMFGHWWALAMWDNVYLDCGYLSLKVCWCFKVIEQFATQRHGVKLSYLRTNRKISGRLRRLILINDNPIQGSICPVRLQWRRQHYHKSVEASVEIHWPESYRGWVTGLQFKWIRNLHNVGFFSSEQVSNLQALRLHAIHPLPAEFDKDKNFFLSTSSVGLFLCDVFQYFCRTWLMKWIRMELAV